MGVKSCSKRGCESIMCDTYVNSVGYVCGECQSDFKTYLNINKCNIHSEEDIIVNLSKFVEIKKQNYNFFDETIVDQFFIQSTSYD